ncbi:Stk1 family PASTA domain-containing Ser/Thr kinase [Laceyella putida]|uniref:Stk1 family PASTA domain-containing Ser/Thr kinase n=1 Tax=Laceyella putida TaxID=110101 RepID=A0ABW2RNF2_9BACL
MEGKKLGGRYEIVSRVGGGGMAVVYKAKDLLLHRYVAIKVLSEALSNDSEFIRRFSREAQAAASLSHPNVVNVYDVGKDGYTHYIVMELVEGPTLKQYILERGPLPVQEAANIAMQICDGLAHAHENQIVHRDIKPHNILLGSNGRAKVTDFGIARAASSSTITQQGSVMGSVHYFSPEQARGGVIGEKSDLYSLGIVLYEMLTGRLPFDGDSAISIALKHLQEQPDDPRHFNEKIPDNMADIIMKALDKDPNKRFASAREMMHALQQAVQLSPRMETNWNSSPKPAQKTMYQTIPLADDDNDHPVATMKGEREPYRSPIQRPEIRSNHTQKQPGLGDQTLANLERLKNVPNSGDQTIFQRTVVWLENVQAKLPWWQKLLFGLFTVFVILTISIWGFNKIWGLISGGSDEPTDGQAQTEWVVPDNLETKQDVEKFVKQKGLPEPEFTYGQGEKDKVLEISPGVGEKFDKTTKFQVKIGVEGKPLDDFTGKFESRMKKISQSVDYKIELYRCPNGSGGFAKIYKQEPAPGTPVGKGDTVKVYSNIPQMPECKLTPWSEVNG